MRRSGIAILGAIATTALVFTMILLIVPGVTEALLAWLTALSRRDKALLLGTAMLPGLFFPLYCTLLINWRRHKHQTGSPSPTS
jgi:hypothetical protein